MTKHNNQIQDRFYIDNRKRLIQSLNIQFDVDLPVSICRNQIAKTIQDNQVVVICGETGSGKSTQLPKICLEIGRGVKGIIGHTQPRRIAARSVAARIADELQTPLGGLVGYKVRFDEKISPNILIKLMTDGILLAESQNDRRFNKYDTIIIDEAHERSLNIDFLLGMMKQILPSRSGLKLIITSATIDAQRFADHFSDQKINYGNAVPIIEVAGRSYPIEIIHNSLDYDNFNESDELNTADNNENFNLNEIVSVSRETDIPQVSAIISAIEELAEHGSGDILVFLSTEKEIIETKIILDRYFISSKNKAGSRVGQVEILPLYSRLPTNNQQQIFKKSSYRKIILSTNVAESSLTVPGIRYVIDTGKARISRYSPRTRTQRLPIEPISQASSDQRAGRCGRIGAGICIRLYSEHDYLQRPRYTPPEILRTNLASVILQTKSLKLGDIEKFPFIDAPQTSAIADGYKTLFEIGAIDSQNNLTEIGRKLSRFPVDPRIGRMIIEAESNDVLSEMLIIAAVLEIQDPRERPRDQQNKADAAHNQFLDPQSDFIAYLNLWDFYHNIKSKASGSSLRKACKQYFLSFNRMKEWIDVHQQLQNFTKEYGMKIQERKNDIQKIYEPLHKAILCGELSGIAERSTSVEYNAAASGNSINKFVIWPGSGIRKLHNAKSKEQNTQNNTADKNNRNENNLNENNRNENSENKPLPMWLLAIERIETERRYLRTAAKINQSWIEPLAKHLIKRIYSEAHWNRETGYVHAYEQTSLFRLVIVAKRRVNYGTIEPETASDIFIRSALVTGEIDTNLDFINYNKELIEEAKSLQAKLRRNDLLKSEDAIYEFYRSRIPAKLVYDKWSLEKWIKSEKPNNLLMSMSDVCEEDVNTDLFPDQLKTSDGSHVFDLEYKFSPGESNDGVTLIIHRDELRQIDYSILSWLVPGLVERKIIALLKSLPKDLRRQLVPIPDTAREIVKRLEFGSDEIEKQLAREITKFAGQAINVSDFNLDLLPAELQMNIRVIDNGGKTLTEGRNLNLLRRELGTTNSTVTSLIGDSKWNKSEITKWDFGELPESVPVNRGKSTIKMFPMISGNQLCLTDSIDRAVSESKLGIVRLFYLSIKREIISQIKWLPEIDKLRIYSHPLPDFHFDENVGQLIAARAFQIESQPIPRTANEFEIRAKNAQTRLGIATVEVLKVISPLLTEFHNARLAIEKMKNPRTKEACEEAKINLMRLVENGFLLKTDFQMLREYPRFFKAVQIRFEKLKTGNENIDKENMKVLFEYRQQYERKLELHNAAGIIDPELELFRWMLEEYRVSLFAQQLGTSIKVSSQRLEKQFEKIKK
ncbi:MAG: ATP-dependent RNA helicase HrpA [Planctomycetaceae bacterium]|jgi:ATP-dependent helicase HrpA|nr:ATP-dependent RNA helicase HrpA [Planctomycetaceae bacterium]